MREDSKILERDNGKQVCYIFKTFRTARKNYESSKRFCNRKGGILPEIKGPKDQSNIKTILREAGDKVAQPLMNANLIL